MNKTANKIGMTNQTILKKYSIRKSKKNRIQIMIKNGKIN